MDMSFCVACLTSGHSTIIPHVNGDPYCTVCHKKFIEKQEKVEPLLKIAHVFIKELDKRNGGESWCEDNEEVAKAMVAFRKKMQGIFREYGKTDKKVLA